LAQVTVIDHPLVQDKLLRIRDEETGCEEFRDLLYGITALMAYEVTKDLAAFRHDVRTPMGTATGSTIRGADLVVVAILRAGLGMVQPFCDLVPGARVGHLGMFRDEETLLPVQYYTKIPGGLDGSQVVIVDPMLATGGSLDLACRILRERGARDMRALSVIAARQGIRLMAERHPGVRIYTAAVDQCLNSIGYIVPGLGDAGDRQFGTFQEE